MRRALLYEIQNDVKRREYLTIIAELPTHPCNHAFAVQNLDGQGVHSASVKFSTVPAKHSSPIWAFKYLKGEASKFSFV